MKVLGFVGSPRAEGTTRFIVDTILKGAAAAGSAVKLVMLNDLNFRGCQGCKKCKQEGICDLQDDFTPLYQEIMEADALVIGSPVYMAYVTGQTKLFLDRLYALKGADQVSRIPAGKRCLLVLTQGYSETDAYQTLQKSLSSLISRMGIEVVDSLIVGGVNSPEDQPAKEAEITALNLGRALVTSGL